MTDIKEENGAETEKKTGLANNLGKFVVNVSGKAKDAAKKTKDAVVNAIDKDGNGKINMEDFGIEKEDIAKAKEKAQELAHKASEGIKKGSDQVSKAIEKAKLEFDKKYLRPVFSEELLKNATDVDNQIFQQAHYPNMICIVDRDKKRNDNEACAGSIGYMMNVKGKELLNIYEDCAQQLGVTFYPNISKTIYYTNPFQTGFYVCLDDYFNYIKKARVNELEQVAKDLGAKRVQITFKELKKTFVSKHAKADVKVGSKKASGSYDTAANEYSEAKIEADVKFSGHDTPIEPNLVYFKGESDIEKLVQMRTSSNDNKIESKIYRFQCAKSSGIKEKDAAEIDMVLGQLKCSGTASVSSEAQREGRTEIEYTIEF